MTHHPAPWGSDGCDDPIHERHWPDVVTLSWAFCAEDDEFWPCAAILAHEAEQPRFETNRSSASIRPAGRSPTDAAPLPAGASLPGTNRVGKRAADAVWARPIRQLASGHGAAGPRALRSGRTGDVRDADNGRRSTDSRCWSTNSRCWRPHGRRDSVVVHDRGGWVRFPRLAGGPALGTSGWRAVAEATPTRTRVECGLSSGVVLVPAQGLPRVLMLDAAIHRGATDGVGTSQTFHEPEVDVAEFLVADALRPAAPVAMQQVEEEPTTVSDREPCPACPADVTGCRAHVSPPSKPAVRSRIRPRGDPVWKQAADQSARSSPRSPTESRGRLLRSPRAIREHARGMFDLVPPLRWYLPAVPARASPTHSWPWSCSDTTMPANVTNVTEG